MKGLLLGYKALFARHPLQVIGDVADSDALKIKNLASRKNGWQHLVLFGSRQNKNGMRGRLLQGFEKCIKCSLREHVNLVDDVDLVLAHLRRKTHLIN